MVSSYELLLHVINFCELYFNRCLQREQGYYKILRELKLEVIKSQETLPIIRKMLIKYKTDSIVSQKSIIKLIKELVVLLEGKISILTTALTEADSFKKELIKNCAQKQKHSQTVISSLKNQLEDAVVELKRKSITCYYLLRVNVLALMFRNTKYIQLTYKISFDSR